MKNQTILAFIIVGGIMSAAIPDNKFQALIIGGKIVSINKNIEFDESGIKSIGEIKYEGNDEIIFGEKFIDGVNLHSMLKENLKNADAMKHIKISDNKLFHDGKRVLIFDDVYNIENAIVWSNWIIAFGSTSRQKKTLNNPEPLDMIFYNTVTLKGGTMCFSRKGKPQLLIYSK